MGIGFIVITLLARYLGPEQFGLYSFALSFVALFAVIPVLGLQNIVVRDIVRNPARKYETLGTTILLQFIGGFAAYFLVIIAIYWLRPEDVLAKMLVIVLGSVIIFKPSEVVNYWFESQVLSKYTVWVNNSSALIFGIVKVVLIINNVALITFAWVALAEALVTALLLCALFSFQGPKLGKLKITLTRARTLLKDCWPLLLSSIGVTIYMKIDQIMLGQLMGNKSVGIYSLATRISEIWYFIPMSIVVSVFPALIQIKKRNQKLYYQRLQNLFDLMTWLSIGVALMITFLSTSIVELLYGKEFTTSGTVLMIHIWTSLFVAQGVASTNWILAENLQIINLQRTIICAIINISLNLWLIPIHGEVGAAFSTLLSYSFAGFFFDLINKKTRKIFFMKVSSLNLLAIYKRYL